MKVFLTHSYFYQLDPKQWANKTPYPPLGSITALSFLQSQNVDTTFYDVALDSSTAKAQKEIEQAKATIVIIYDDGFNYLTKMCLTNMRNACFELIKSAKINGAKVIVSSSDSTDHANLYHAEGADVVILGEAEHALLESIHSFENSTSLSFVNGISYLEDQTINKTAPRASVVDLDEIPNANWDAINIEKYRSIWKNGKFPFTLNISTTRGCPFKCNWCAKPIYGNRYKSRSPKRVVEELKLLNKKYGVKHFWITDDIFGLKPGWVGEFNQLIQENALKIHYKIQSRADLLMKDHTIDELVQSGLEEVWIGAESGSQKILDAMDKGITLEQIEKSTSLLQQKGARVAYFLQFGYLGETKDDILKTIRMVKKNRPDDIGISVSYPLPGTKFFDLVKSQMGSKANWEDSDDLDLMFKGTFSSDFYRALQRYVHHAFRFQQGIQKLKGRKAISWRYVLLIPYNLIASFSLKRKLR